MTPIVESESSDKRNSPWWVSAITTFGVPAAIAMYLVWALVSGQTNILIDIQTTLHGQRSMVAEVAAVTKSTAEEARTARARQEEYLRLLCVNTAKSQADRNACLSVR